MSIHPHASYAPRSALRLPWLDAARGTALCAMIVFHFCFDLSWFGIITANFYRDPFWVTARTLILSSFLLIVGISLHVAYRQGLTPAAFWRRVLKIAAAALLVSVASYAVFPQSFIYFGVLHFIAIASIIALPFAGFPRWALPMGVLIILAGITYSFPIFNPKPLSWIGFVTTLPRTEDFVPLFPWLGVVLFGIGITPHLPMGQQVAPPPENWWLRWMGQHSLMIYLVHQPLMLGMLWCAVKVLR